MNIKEKLKLHRDQNREEYQKQRKLNYERNKSKILDKLGTIIICSCGCNITIGNKTRHEKSQKHLNLMDAKTSKQEIE